MKEMRKRAVRARALLARAAGTRQKFLLALGHPTLRLRGRGGDGTRSAINGADKILGIRAIRVREEVQWRAVRIFFRAIETRPSRVFCEIITSGLPTPRRAGGRGGLRRVSILDRRC